ncbi:hypothetical protein Tco_0402156 [Tanacetum coccineum]
MTTYLKNMVGWKLKDLKNKSFVSVQELFENAMKKVNTFVDMDTKLVEGSKISEEESSSKRADDVLEQEPTKKQKIHRKGMNGYYEIMRAYGSAKTYLLFSQLLKEFDREDLENLWKLVKAKHGNTRPEEVHFVRFEDIHVYMLVEKRYPLKPATITDTMNKKLKFDYWNEICYQLLKLMTKQLKNPRSGRIVRIKSFIRLFGITAALIEVSAAQEERRANRCIVSITKSDYKNLNKNDIEDMYLLIINHKVDDYAETGLLWSLSVFIRSMVIWERVHDFQLGVESYQQQVNLTAPTITFLGIKKYKVLSIIFELVYGIIYKNSKKEKRVMRHKEAHKFCDATLKRVLEGLKSYNNDVKYGYVTHNLSN